jgi:hypothetical protein
MIALVIYDEELLEIIKLYRMLFSPAFCNFPLKFNITPPE